MLNSTAAPPAKAQAATPPGTYPNFAMPCPTTSAQLLRDCKVEMQRFKSSISNFQDELEPIRDANVRNEFSEVPTCLGQRAWFATAKEDNSQC